SENVAPVSHSAQEGLFRRCKLGMGIFLREKMRIGVERHGDRAQAAQLRCPQSRKGCRQKQWPIAAAQRAKERPNLIGGGDINAHVEFAPMAAFVLGLIPALAPGRQILDDVASRKPSLLGIAY